MVLVHLLGLHEGRLPCPSVYSVTYLGERSEYSPHFMGYDRRFCGSSCSPHCPSVGHSVLSGDPCPRSRSTPRLCRPSHWNQPPLQGCGSLFPVLRWHFGGAQNRGAGVGGVGQARARPQGTALGKARPRVHPCVLDSGPGQAPVLPHAATLVTLFPMMEDTLSSRAAYLLFSVQPQCARRGPSS